MEATKEYLKGFNNGYTIRKNHPLLMKNLIKGVKGNTEYLRGLEEGSKQYEIEMNMKINRYKKARSAQEKKDRGMEM